MADLVDRIRAELHARVRELQPVAREFERLERAAAALSRAGPPTPKPKVGKAAQPRRSGAPGQARAKVLEALAAAPGSSAAAVAKATGVPPTVAATTLSRLVKEGRVRRVERGSYAVVDTPPGDRANDEASPPPPAPAE